MEMGRFLVIRRLDGEYHFVLMANNYEPILISEGYLGKDNCIQGINSVRIHSQIEEKYEKNVSSNRKLYFNLVGENGEVIGTSEMYANQDELKNCMYAVKEHAPDATVKDLTF